MHMENFAPIMFAGLVVIMLIGFPVAFSLAALGLFSGFFAIEMGWFPVGFMANLPLNVFGILSNETLLAIPFFLNMLHTGEISGNIGGLIRWPAALMMPLGFGAMFLQGVAEIIKRIAYLRGLIEMDTHYEKPVQ